MTGMPDGFRPFHRLDLKPNFVSLGLQARLFRDAADADGGAFDAALSGPGDILWLFRGEDFLAYDLRRDVVVRPPSPIAAGWAGGALPPTFKVGIDSAVWAGPALPGIVYLFRGAEFLRLDCSADPAEPLSWTITLDPFPTADEWLRTPSTDGIPRRGPVLDPCARLYGLREAANRIHCFTRDNRYARHNLENGEHDVAPCATTERFPLPPAFAGRVDLAFYGAGNEAEHLFFFAGDQYAELDLRRNAVVRAGAIEQRFPALGMLLPRPQLYVVEDHALETYVGPLSLGRLVSTLQVPPESRRTSIVETRVVTPAVGGLRGNLIEQASPEAIADFYARLGAMQPQGAAPAPETTLWGGEVDSLGGGQRLNDRRAALIEAAFAAIEAQTRQSAAVVERQVVDVAQPTTGAGAEILNRETFELVNTGDRTRQIEFMELVQQFLTLAVLRNVHLAYANGRDAPTVFALREVDALLADILVDPGQAGAVIAYLKQQLARIQDSSGEMRSFIAEGPDLNIDARVQSVFVVDDTSPPQTIKLFGLIQAARRWYQPTYQTRAIDIAAVNDIAAAGADRSMAAMEVAIVPVTSLPVDNR